MVLRRKKMHFFLKILVASAYITFYHGIDEDNSEFSQNGMEVLWNFQTGLQGWAKSTTDEMDAEIDVTFEGEMKGIVRGPNPHFDSPRLLLRASNNHHYFAIRMAYSGNCDQGKISIETGAQLQDERHVPFNSNMHQDISFKLISDGEYHTYYIPLWKKLSGTITRCRIYPAISSSTYKTPRDGHSFSIEWIFFLKGPIIDKVLGCIDIYYSNVNRLDPTASLTSVLTKTNGFHDTYSTIHGAMELPYATTFSCPRKGGERITINGRNFGKSDAIVLIDGKECTNLVHIRTENEIQCDLPPGTKNPAMVTIKNGKYPGLLDEGLYLSYVAPSPALSQPTITNVASHAMDINWVPPKPFWIALSITGYRILWKSSSELSYERILDVGNVTTTTLIGLVPKVQYSFKVAAVVEDKFGSDEWKEIDLYGRRKLLPNAVIGEYSIPSVPTSTLNLDFNFDGFNAYALISHGSAHPGSSIGPTGESGGQGHYGLTVVGDAGVENCNASVVCCDNYDTQCTWTCSGIGTRIPDYKDGISNRGVRTSLSGYDAHHQVVVDKAENLNHEAKAFCGPSLRLTSSHSLLAGAAWYPRRMNVREGFETYFEFRLSAPSSRCKYMDDVYTHCRSRGGDGFAFVIQSHDPAAIGKGGMEMGYGGLKNSIAIEFDTFYNPETLEPYENHISVHTRGWRDDNSANQSYSLGSTSRISDITEKLHQVRLVYSPIFDEDSLFSGKFEASPHASYFLSNADFVNGGQADWSTGMGTLTIYYDDLANPTLVVPLNIDSSLKLYHGRAWVGFTAATGTESWQTHDILKWSFSSLRVEPPNKPPVLVNGVGFHQCVKDDVCIHK